MLTVILFLLLLSLIIVIHELGHLAAAKKFNVYCYEFSFGMGPKLWSRKGKETEYCIRAIPIGGYVSMAGENDGMEEMYPDIHVDESRTITAQKPWKKIIIMLAGVFMNFLLAWVIFSMIILGNGAYRLSPKAEVGSVVADSPAEKAGFQAGDEILKIDAADGSSIEPTSFLDMQLFMPTDGSEMTYTIQRGEETISIQVTPEYSESEQTYLIGITAPDSETVAVNLLNCWSYGAAEMGYITRMMLISIRRLLHGVGLNQLSGPVGIYSATETYAAMGFSSYMFLVAELSLNVGIFNLLPLPVLDGGRVVITLVEWIVGKPLNKKWKLQSWEHAGFC